MLPRHKKSKAPSVASTASRKMGRGPSKEDELIKNIQNQDKARSQRMADEIRKILRIRQFGFYEKSLKLYANKLRVLEAERERLLSTKPKVQVGQKKTAWNDDFRRMCKFRLSIILRASIDAIKLIRPYYYESDLALFVTLARLNGEQTMCKLYEFMNTPFPNTIQFFIRSIVSRSLSQLSIENYSHFVDPLFTLGNKSSLDPAIRVTFILPLGFSC